jgi:hypothetical protein
MATIDLKEYWGLTEEQAQELLTKLDEGNRQKAEVREWGC